MKTCIKRLAGYAKCIEEIPGKLELGKVYEVIFETDSLYFYKADNCEILCFHEFFDSTESEIFKDPAVIKRIDDEITHEISIALKGNYTPENHQKFLSQFKYLCFDDGPEFDNYQIDYSSLEYFKIKTSIQNIFKFAACKKDHNWYYVHQIETKSYYGKTFFVIALQSLKYNSFNFYKWDELYGNISVGDIIVLNNNRAPTGFYKVNTAFKPKVSLPDFVFYDKYICIKSWFDGKEDLIGVYEILPS